MSKEDTMPTIASASSPSLMERWGDQFSEPFAQLRTEIDRLFDDFGARPFATGISRRLASLTGPALEMRENEGEFCLSVEVPGLKVQDIEIRVNDGILLIKGERKEERDEKKEGYVFSERRYGSFERAVELPRSVNADKISADCKDGLLTVHLPKREEVISKQKTIPITSK